MDFIDRYRKANVEEMSGNNVVGSNGNRWNPPPVGVFKINSDAAFDEGTGKWSLAW